jgi:hypothetical protein
VAPPVPRTPRRGLPRTSAAVALALLVSLLAPVAGTGAVLGTANAASATVTATATATDVGAPSWWVGDCDATRWNTLAKSMGWTGVGSHRLGASYLGVPVCGPRPWVDGSPNVLWARAGWGEAEWQCVEVAQRFMAQVYGTQAYGANGSQVVNNYRTTYGGNLVKITNGTVGKAPVPGDIVSFTTPNNPYGHVVVITSSTVDGNGNGSVTMLSQNDTSNGWRTLPVVSWRMQGFGSLTPYGWLHDPAGRGNPLGDGTFVRVAGQARTYRVVGGAPVVVGSWSAYGGVQPVTLIEQAQLDRLRAYPQDGTYVSDTATQQVYRMAGGAPLEVAPAEQAAMPGWGTAPVWAVDHYAFVRLDHMQAFPVDRTSICRVDDKSCYLVVGGAPMRIPAAEIPSVPSFSARSATIVSSAEFTSYTHLRPTPADGTALCDAGTGYCYTTAGGSPLGSSATDLAALPGASAARANTVSHWEFTKFEHLRPYPAEGTVLCPVATTTCFVVAGRAPLPITTTAAATIAALPTPGSVRVSGWELAHPVHLRARPLDGTVIQGEQSGAVYVVAAGVARRVANPPASATTTLPFVVDQAAVDNAGRPGVWSHLASSPAVVRLTSPTDAITRVGTTTVTWAAPVSSSAVVSYTLRYRRASVWGSFNAWTTPTSWQRLTTTRIVVALAPGYTTCFQVRATNRAGQIGPWSPTLCTARVLDERSATAVSARWTRMTGTVYYARTALSTTRHAAAWALGPVTVSRVAILATTCPTCGVVSVYVGTTRIGTVSLARPTTGNQQLITLPRFTPRKAKVTIVVSSPDGRLVRLDGVGISRA